MQGSERERERDREKEGGREIECERAIFSFLCMQGCTNPLHRSAREREREREGGSERKREEERERDM
jgi:hypothetical protein